MEKVHTVRTQNLTKTAYGRHLNSVKETVNLLEEHGCEVSKYMPSRIYKPKDPNEKPWYITELHYFLPVLTPVK